MLEETRRLSDLVDALLLLARADTSGVSPSLEQVDLTGLVNEIRETLVVLAEEKNQQIEIIAEQLTIRADRELLRLALLNLVHNAIRYSRIGQDTHQDAAEPHGELQHTAQPTSSIVAS